MSRVDEAYRLLAVHGLRQMTVKKCILHVKLVDWPRSRSSNAEDNAYRGRLYDGAECLVVVDAVALRKSVNHPTRLVAG